MCVVGKQPNLLLKSQLFLGFKHDIFLAFLNSLEYNVAISLLDDNETFIGYYTKPTWA